LSKKPDTAAERRKHPRHTKKVEVHGTPDNGGVVARMVTNDLSMGGLHCVSTADFPEMTRLAVRLMLPPRNGGSAVPLDVEAVVVRREEFASANGDPRYELALYFTNVHDGTRERLARFLNG
jgi:hypothetical protein